MPAVKLSPLFNSQTVTASGAPAYGYKIYTYVAGSSTPLAAYTDSAGSVAQTNPIVLNADGYPTNPIWLQAGLSYKFVLRDANDVIVGSPWDNVAGVNDTATAFNQWQASSVTPTYISSTSFSVPGDQTSEFHIGRRVQCTVTAGTVYGTIISSSYSTLTTVTLVFPSGGLDSGLSAVNLSILRADKPALPAGPIFCATRLTTDQPIANSTDTVVLFNAEDYDIGNCYDPTTGRFMPNMPGYYEFTLNMKLGGSGVSLISYSVRKNGVIYQILSTLQVAYNGQPILSATTPAILLNGTNDYVDFTAFVTATSGNSVFIGSRVSGKLVRFP